jgi:copper chaperone CopZ
MKRSFNLITIIALLTTSVFLLTAYSADTNAPAPIIVQVNGMVCDFCARALEKNFLKQVEVNNVAIDLTAKTLAIFLKPGAQLEDAEIEQLVKQAGYNVENISRR